MRVIDSFSDISFDNSLRDTEPTSHPEVPMCDDHSPSLSRNRRHMEIVEHAEEKLHSVHSITPGTRVIGLIHSI